MMGTIRQGDGFSYKVVRSNRKSVEIQFGRDGSFLLRVPMRYPEFMIEKVLREKQDWIRRKQVELKEAQAERHMISEEERKSGIERAKRIFPERTAYYASHMGVTYGRITIREQKTRWGSCSTAGNLNFNWKLVLMPLEVLDYVVVHELAHRKEMNHSIRFWKIVECELPDYMERRRLLRQYEQKLMG